MRKELKLLILFSITVFMFSCGEKKEVERKPDLPSAPEIVLKDLEGKEYKLSDYKGKVVLLNFWATWCGPCKKEMPDLVKLKEEYKNKDFEIFGITLQSDMEIAKQQIKEFGLNYPILWAEGESEENIAKNYGIRVFPTTYIIDKDGKVRLRLLGQQTKDFFEAKIKEIL